MFPTAYFAAAYFAASYFGQSSSAPDPALAAIDPAAVTVIE